MAYPFTAITLHLSDAHLRALGKLSIYITQIEKCLQYMIHHLLELHEAYLGLAVTAELGSRDIEHILKAITNEKYPDTEFSTRLSSLLGAINALKGERNTLVHASWDTTQWHGWSERITVKAKGIVKIDSEYVSAEEIEEICQRAQNIIGELDAVGELIGISVSPHYVRVSSP